MKIRTLSMVLLFSGVDGSTVRAQAIIAPDKLLTEITQRRTVNQGCRIVARMSIESLKKVGTPACVVPEPTGTTKLACAVGLALQNRVVDTAAASGITAGCSWVVKNTSKEIVEITITVVKEADASVEEMKA